MPEENKDLVWPSKLKEKAGHTHPFPERIPKARPLFQATTKGKINSVHSTTVVFYETKTFQCFGHPQIMTNTKPPQM